MIGSFFILVEMICNALLVSGALRVRSFSVFNWRLLVPADSAGFWRAFQIVDRSVFKTIVLRCILAFDWFKHIVLHRGVSALIILLLCYWILDYWRIDSLCSGFVSMASFSGSSRTGGRLWSRAVKASSLESRFLLLWLPYCYAFYAWLIWFGLHFVTLPQWSARSVNHELTKLQGWGKAVVQGCESYQFQCSGSVVSAIVFINTWSILLKKIIIKLSQKKARPPLGEALPSISAAAWGLG